MSKRRKTTGLRPDKIDREVNPDGTISETELKWDRRNYRYFPLRVVLRTKEGRAIGVCEHFDKPSAKKADAVRIHEHTITKRPTENAREWKKRRRSAGIKAWQKSLTPTEYDDGYDRFVRNRQKRDESIGYQAKMDFYETIERHHTDAPLQAFASQAFNANGGVELSYDPYGTHWLDDGSPLEPIEGEREGLYYTRFDKYIPHGIFADRQW